MLFELKKNHDLTLHSNNAVPPGKSVLLMPLFPIVQLDNPPVLQFECGKVKLYSGFQHNSWFVRGRLFTILCVLRLRLIIFIVDSLLGLVP